MTQDFLLILILLNTVWKLRFLHPSMLYQCSPPSAVHLVTARHHQWIAAWTIASPQMSTQDGSTPESASGPCSVGQAIYFKDGLGNVSSLDQEGDQVLGRHGTTRDVASVLTPRFWGRLGLASELVRLCLELWRPWSRSCLGLNCQRLGLGLQGLGLD